MIVTLDQLPDAVRAEYPYVSRFVSVNGMRMHHVDEGPRDAPPVVLLHGNPTWGYLWRDTMRPLLEAGFRVVVPDQIGFGLSEKPSLHGTHTLANHTANVVALLDALDLRGVVLGLHDWGGPTGLGAAVSRPDRIAAIAVMSTWAWTASPAEFHQRVLPWRTLHAPLLGPYLMGRRAAMPGRGMYLSVVDRARFADGAQHVYEAILSDPADRDLTWTWPRSIPIGLPSDIETEHFRWLEAEVRALHRPSTVIWGREDDVFEPGVFAAHWHEIWPHAEGTHLVTGRHFLQEDSGAEIGALLVDFADRAVRSAGGS
ncbi:alpha/beta fold hydrolase [Pseudonocardia sp. D17]|uniref:alpha/beta fold hydrolase n=1 Tax=Pseudonocardia sp. D17 TaxID=882661 RepID=UPI0030D2D08F|nr:haloalkane dehalogenase 1 [Pseudonocardia sp. D17]